MRQDEFNQQKDRQDWRISILFTVILLLANLLLWSHLKGRMKFAHYDVLLLILGVVSQALVFGATLFGQERELSRYSERRDVVVMGGRYKEGKKFKTFLDRLGGTVFLVKLLIVVAGWSYVFLFGIGKSSYLGFILGAMVAAAFVVDILWAPLIVSGYFLLIACLGQFGSNSWTFLLVGGLIAAEICVMQWLVHRIKESDRIPGVASPSTFFEKEWLRPLMTLGVLFAIAFAVLPKGKEQDEKPKDDPKNESAEKRVVQREQPRQNGGARPSFPAGGVGNQISLPNVDIKLPELDLTQGNLPEYVKGLAESQVNMPQESGGGQGSLESLDGLEPDDFNMTINGKNVTNPEVKQQVVELAKQSEQLRKLKLEQPDATREHQRLESAMQQSFEGIQNSDFGGGGDSSTGSKGVSPSDGRSSDGEAVGSNNGREIENPVPKLKEKPVDKKFIEKLLKLLIAALVIGGLVFFILDRQKKKKQEQEQDKQPPLTPARLRAAQKTLYDNLQMIAKKYPSLSEQVIVMYNALLGFYRTVGLEKPQHYTPDEYLYALSSQLPDKRHSIGDVTRIFTRTLYGKVEPDQETYGRYVAAVKDLSSLKIRRR